MYLATPQNDKVWRGGDSLESGSVMDQESLHLQKRKRRENEFGTETNSPPGQQLGAPKKRRTSYLAENSGTSDITKFHLKLPPSPTYHSSRPQPRSPEPVEALSFLDLIAENNRLRSRIEAFEAIDKEFMESAAKIGKAAFSDPLEDHEIEPLRATLRELDSPASEACLILLENLTKTHTRLAESRNQGMQQFLKVEELHDEVRKKRALVKMYKKMRKSIQSQDLNEQDQVQALERVGGTNNLLLEERNSLVLVLKKRDHALQEKARHIKALVETNKRFKELQFRDKAAIIRLHKNIDELAREHSWREQQRSELARSSIIDLQRLYKQLKQENHNQGPNPYLSHDISFSRKAENRKTVEALAKVLALLRGVNYTKPTVPLPLETPSIFIPKGSGLSNWPSQDPEKKRRDEPEVEVLLRKMAGRIPTANSQENPEDADDKGGAKDADKDPDNTKDPNKPDPEDAKDEEDKDSAPPNDTEEIFDGLTAIADGDPCREWKIALRDNQARWIRWRDDQIAELNEDQKARDLEITRIQSEDQMKYNKVIMNANHRNIALEQALKALQAEDTKKEKAIRALTTLNNQLKDGQGSEDSKRGTRGQSKTKKQIDDLEKKIATLNDELEQLTAENREMRQERWADNGGEDPCAVFKKQIQELRDEIVEKDNEIKTKKTRVPPKLKKEHQELQEQVKTLKDENEKLKREGGVDDCDQCAKYMERIKKLELQATENEEKMKKLKQADDSKGDGDRDQCAKHKKQINDLQLQVTKNQEEIKQLKQTSEADEGVKDEIVELQERLARVRRRLKTRKNEAIALNNKLTESEDKSGGTMTQDLQTRVNAQLEHQRSRFMKRIRIMHGLKQAQMFSAAGEKENVKASGPIINPFPSATLMDMLKQDGPPIRENTDAWFAEQWDYLYDQVMLFCRINYRGRVDHVPYDYAESAQRDELLSYYLRDSVLSEHAMHDSINDPKEVVEHTYREKVAVAIIFRIFDDEIFTPIRFLLNLRFPSHETWKTKMQYRQAFEQFENPDFPLAQTRRGFQIRESWCTRQAQQAGRSTFQPKRRRDENYNWMEALEEKNFDGHNGDAVIFNASRAKLFLGMFQAIDDTILYNRFRELRVHVSMLIRDTLEPFQLPRGEPPDGGTEPFSREGLKHGVAHIIKAAYNLAVTMRCQRRVIYIDYREQVLANMIPFQADTMTDVEQPEDRKWEDQNIHNLELQGLANAVEDRLNPVGKLEVIVQPALWRRGNEEGNFASANVQVIKRAKVICRKI